MHHPDKEWVVEISQVCQAKIRNPSGGAEEINQRK